MKLLKWFFTIAVIAIVVVMLIWLLGISGIVASIAWSLLVLIVSNYDRAVQISSHLLTLFRKFSFWAEKRKVANYLQGTISLCARKVNEERENLLPHGVRIKFVEPTERDVFLKEGKVVVYMESSYNEARNLARATMLYVAEDLIRNSRRFVDEAVIKSADFVVARKMLMFDRKLDALRCLNEEFITPKITKTPAIEPYILFMERMDMQGTFTRILLNEFSNLDGRLPPTPSSPQAEVETIEFTEMMKEFTEKEPGVDVYPDQLGQVIRTTIMPIKRRGVEANPVPYIAYAGGCLNEQIFTLYVVARGANVALAQWVVQEIEKRRWYVKQKEYLYKIVDQRGSVPAYVAVLAIHSSKLKEPTAT